MIVMYVWIVEEEIGKRDAEMHWINRRDAMVTRFA